MANQAVVSGSACASGKAPATNAASSPSLPGLASSVTSSPTVTIAVSSVSAGIRPQGGHGTQSRAGLAGGGRRRAVLLALFVVHAGPGPSSLRAPTDGRLGLRPPP